MMRKRGKISSKRPDLIDQIPSEPVPATVHRIYNWLFPIRMWDTVEFRSLRFLSWGGYAIALFGLILGFGSSFLLEPFYLPVVFCVFGVLLAVVDRSEAKDETRISVDLRARLISIKAKGKVQWQIPFDQVVAIQIAYLVRKYYGRKLYYKEAGRSEASELLVFSSEEDGSASIFQAYQVNLVFLDDAQSLQRKTISDARTKWPSALVASKISALIGVAVVDHASRQDVRERRENTECEEYI